METCSVVLTFESVNEMLRCDHSKETSSAVLLYGTVTFYTLKFGIFALFGVKGLKTLLYSCDAKAL